MERKIIGYVIGVTPYKDNDAMINLITDKGKESLRARGILKPTSKNAAACQLFRLSEFVVNYKVEDGHQTLKTASSIKWLKDVLSSPLQMTFLSFLCEVLYQSEAKYGESYYHFFDQVIDYFNHGYQDYITLSLVTLSNLMRQEGIFLEANECIHCGSEQDLETVSYGDGGFLCYDCRMKMKVMPRSKEYLRSYRLVMLASIEDVTKFHIEKSIGLELLNDFFIHFEDATGMQFRFKKILLSVLK